MDLERELRSLELAWPETPELRLELGARTRDRRPLVAALALAAVIAVAVALSVPQSRGAILRFLHLGGVTIERVGTLPSAQERPLGAGLGPVVSAAEARRALGTAPLLPPSPAAPTLHESGGVVSVLFLDRGRPVLLSELGADDPAVLKKLLASQTSVESVSVGGRPGFWLSGAPHAVALPGGVPPRLAGDVLLWQQGGLTLRLEGRGLTRARALALARSFRSSRDTP